jgi:hypothetical protein
MTYRFLILVAAAAMLNACASWHPITPGNGETIVGRAPIADVAAMSSQRDIVLTVANPLEPTSMHAGSSLLGYMPSRYYGAGQRAAITLAA